MTRERAAFLLPIIKAYSEGKDIEFKHRTEEGSQWHLASHQDQDGLEFNNDYDYRIYKPSFTIRTVKRNK